jgi:pimeloyl-ACP methyl ester carboxylesterase
MRAPDTLLRILSREWSGLALGVALVGVGVWMLTASTGATWWIGAGAAGLGALMSAGGLIHLNRLARTRRLHPPPGRLVDVAGTRIHVLAEGAASGTLPIVIFGGSHSAGLTMQHVHDALKTVTRSILIDRPGTGWSDTGPFPRTTAREADEMAATLAAAGETGPFVLAGYSFGGLLAANIARRYPQLVARLVLIDATPLETLVFGPRLGAIETMLAKALRTGLLRLFGVPARPDGGRPNPAHSEAVDAFSRTLGPALVKLRAVEVSAGSQFAGYSIYHELKGDHIGTCGWETVVYDGDLGDLPVWLVAPGDAREVVAEPEVGAAQGAEAARMLRFFATSRERYMAISSASRVVAPPGSTHQFVYTHPEFIIGVLQDSVRPDLP